MALRLYLLLGGLVAVGLGLWGIAAHFDSRGYDRCHAEWEAAVAQAKTKRDAELFVAQLRGDALSKTLAETQQKYGNLRAEYLTYANSITGNCPADLGVLVQSASTSAGVPKTPGASPDPSATIAASAIAANIATNYPRCHAAIAQLNALIDWYSGPGPKEAVK